MEHYFKNYLISTNKDLLDLEKIKELLSLTYWANNRSYETIKKSIENSLCYGIYDENKAQVGFGRVITDYATIYYITDVVIDEENRSKGLGKELISLITKDKLFNSLSGVLATNDAHSLYEKFGFVVKEDIFMQRKLK